LDEGGAFGGDGREAGGLEGSWEDVAKALEGFEDSGLSCVLTEEVLSASDGQLAQRAELRVFGSSSERAELDLSASDGGALVVLEVRDDLRDVVVGNGLAGSLKGKKKKSEKRSRHNSSRKVETYREARWEIRAELVEVSDDFGLGGVVSELSFDPGHDEFASYVIGRRSIRHSSRNLQERCQK